MSSLSEELERPVTITVRGQPSSGGLSHGSDIVSGNEELLFSTQPLPSRWNWCSTSPHSSHLHRVRETAKCYQNPLRRSLLLPRVSHRPPRISRSRRTSWRVPRVSLVVIFELKSDKKRRTGCVTIIISSTTLAAFCLSNSLMMKPLTSLTPTTATFRKPDM